VSKQKILSRYNSGKRGSFQVTLSFYDWELSITIGAIRSARVMAREKGKRAYLNYLSKLEKKYSDALSTVLKAELSDLKLKDGQKELG